MQHGKQPAQTDKQLEELRRAARKWAGWESPEAIEAEESQTDSESSLANTRKEKTAMMEITEAGRARVKSEAFLEEFESGLRAVLRAECPLDEKFATEASKPWMLRFLALALAGKPVDYEPTQDEINGFMALNKPEVIAAGEDLATRLLARWAGAAN